MAWAVAGLLQASGHRAEAWGLLKPPHMGTHISTHSSSRPGTQIHGPSPIIYSMDAKRCVTVRILVCIHATSQKRSHVNQRSLSGPSSLSLSRSLPPRLLSTWESAGLCWNQDVAWLRGLLRVAEGP